MTAVTGFDDRSMVNQCLMYRYIISYEPYNFKGHLDDYPRRSHMARRWTRCAPSCASTSGTASSATPSVPA